MQKTNKMSNEIVEIEEKVSKQELENVLSVMKFYNRTWGFIAKDSNNVLRFYDSEPSQGGAYVTIEDIKEFIEG